MSSALTRPRPTLAALVGRPRYSSFVVTVFLARIGATMFTTSGVLLVLARTNSAVLAGLTAAAATLPAALTGPLLGAWVDVARRRRVLIVADQLLSVVGLVAILLLAGHAPDWTVPAAAAVYSVTRPLSTGSFSSALAEIAGTDLLDLASSIEASSLNLSFVVGPAVAGALAGATGAATAVDAQIVVTLLVAGLIAVNPVFEVRPQQRIQGIRRAVRDGTRALMREPVLRAVGGASTLAVFGWGLMTVGFPLYAAGALHARAHAGGYLWAGLAGGSIVGTFVLRGGPSLRRIGLSYGVLGCSALLWPLIHVLWAGIVAVTFTGVLEGPAYSGTIALRQRHAPPALRAQALTTLASFALVASAAGAAIGGVVHDLDTLVIVFVAVNLLAAALTAGRDRSRTSWSWWGSRPARAWPPAPPQARARRPLRFPGRGHRGGPPTRP